MCMWTDGWGIRNRRDGGFSSHATRQILREHRSWLQLAVLTVLGNHSAVLPVNVVVVVVVAACNGPDRVTM